MNLNVTTSSQAAEDDANHDITSNVTTPAAPPSNVTTNMTSLMGEGRCSLVENLHFCISGVVIIALNAVAVADTVSNRAMRGWTKVLLVNLMSSDALNGMFNIVYWLAPCIRWIGLCDMFLAVTTIHVQVLCLSVMYITASRLLLLLKGPAFRRLANTSRALAVVLASWTLVISLSILWVQLSKDASLQGCLGRVTSTISPQVILVPLTLVMVCPMYVAMIHLVRKQLRRVDQHQPHPAVRNLPRVPLWNNETRVTVVAILIITCFCVCYLPSLYVLLQLYVDDSQVHGPTMLASMVLQNVQPLLDPILYSWRLGHRCTCCRLCGRCQSLLPASHLPTLNGMRG